MSDKPLIKLHNIKKSYQIGGNHQQVLNGVALDVYKGELMSIMGQSGSGKSTLMNIMGLLDRADEGEYYFEGGDVSRIDNDVEDFVSWWSDVLANGGADRLPGYLALLAIRFDNRY